MNMQKQKEKQIVEWPFFKWPSSMRSSSSSCSTRHHAIHYYTVSIINNAERERDRWGRFTFKKPMERKKNRVQRRAGVLAEKTRWAGGRRTGDEVVGRASRDHIIFICSICWKRALLCCTRGFHHTTTHWAVNRVEAIAAV